MVSYIYSKYSNVLVRLIAMELNSILIVHYV